MKVLIVGDPLSSLHIDLDSSLFFAEGFLSHGAKVDWVETSSLSLFNNEVIASKVFPFTKVSSTGFSNADPQTNRLVDSYDLVVIRQDPPFDAAYQTLCWLLSLVQTKVLNHPFSLLSLHEKISQFLAHQDGILDKKQLISTSLITSLDSLALLQKNIPASATGYIVKPWYGHGGRGVQFFPTQTELKNYLNQIQTSKTFDAFLVQPFLPQIHSEGDRRVFLLGGECIGSFVRLPAKGKVTSNLASGGTAHLIPMSKELEKKMQKLAKFCLDAGVMIAGVDVIGNFIGEINVTSPTGFRMLNKLTGKFPPHEVVQKILRHV